QLRAEPPRESARGDDAAEETRARDGGDGQRGREPERERLGTEQMPRGDLLARSRCDEPSRLDDARSGREDGEDETEAAAGEQRVRAREVEPVPLLSIRVDDFDDARQLLERSERPRRSAVELGLDL